MRFGLGARGGNSENQWRPTRRSDLFDASVGAVLTGGAVLWLYIGTDPALVGESADFNRVLGFGAIVAMHVPLVVRRRYPVVAVLLAAVGLAYLRLADIPELQVSGVSLFVALYTAGAYAQHGRNLSRSFAAVVVGALVVWAIADTQGLPAGTRIPVEVLSLLTAAANAFYLAAAWMLGDVVRHRREREAQLEAKSRALEAAQTDLAHQAVVAERVRIARELHDVLAHHVSVMGVHAAAARRVLNAKPDTVSELLTGIESSSREAVVELQRLLGLLRPRNGDRGDNPAAGDHHAPTDIDPQPSLARLSALADQMRETGLSVDLEVDGIANGSPLPLGVDLSAFRIVQEALTNTLKHGGHGVRAEVVVRQRPSSLEVVVLDDGRTDGRADGAGSAYAGLGIVGMRERVALHGGELRTGRRNGGGFEVRAWFPLPSAP